jgi:hypothetical protein
MPACYLYHKHLIFTKDQNTSTSRQSCRITIIIIVFIIGEHVTFARAKMVYPISQLETSSSLNFITSPLTSLLLGRSWPLTTAGTDHHLKISCGIIIIIIVIVNITIVLLALASYLKAEAKPACVLITCNGRSIIIPKHFLKVKRGPELLHFT